MDTCTQWSRVWLMRFNIAKCKVMHVGIKAKSTHSYTMIDEQGDRKQLSVTTSERDLGVLVTDNLSLSAQCKAAAAAANWKFGVLEKSFSSRSQAIWTKLWT